MNRKWSALSFLLFFLVSNTFSSGVSAGFEGILYEETMENYSRINGETLRWDSHPSTTYSGPSPSRSQSGWRCFCAGSNYRRAVGISRLPGRGTCRSAFESHSRTDGSWPDDRTRSRWTALESPDDNSDAINSDARGPT